MRKKQIKLRLKALLAAPEEHVIEEDAVEQEETLTAMEIAYRKALEGNGDSDSSLEGASDDGEEISSHEQEDIITRTLEHKSRTK